MEYNLQNNRIDSGDFSIDNRLHLSNNFSSDMKESRGFSMDTKDSRSFSMDSKDSRGFSMDSKDSRSFSMDSKDSRSFSMDTKDSRSFSMDTKDSRSFSMDTRDSRSFSTDSKVASRGFSMDTKESNGFAAERTPEEVVNSIKITEGPVTHMSMAVQKTSRTPYSDATQVSAHASIRTGCCRGFFLWLSLNFSERQCRLYPPWPCAIRIVPLGIAYQHFYFRNFLLSLALFLILLPFILLPFF
jgi:hypothetical protein